MDVIASIVHYKDRKLLGVIKGEFNKKFKEEISNIAELVLDDSSKFVIYPFQEGSIVNLDDVISFKYEKEEVEKKWKGLREYRIHKLIDRDIKKFSNKIYMLNIGNSVYVNSKFLNEDVEGIIQQYDVFNKEILNGKLSESGIKREIRINIKQNIIDLEETDFLLNSDGKYVMITGGTPIEQQKSVRHRKKLISDFSLRESNYYVLLKKGDKELFCKSYMFKKTHHGTVYPFVNNAIKKQQEIIVGGYFNKKGNHLVLHYMNIKGLGFYFL